MKTTKDLAIIGLFTALLIAGQLAFAAISGVEIVTLLFTAFCFYFGVFRGVVVGITFSLLRMLVFGFFPSVLILYLAYYVIFAIVIGLVGRAMKKTLNVKSLLITVFAVLLLTGFFTVLDNLITPIFYGYSVEATKAYWVASLSAVIPQCVCAVVTVGLLLPPLVKIFEKSKL